MLATATADQNAYVRKAGTGTKFRKGGEIRACPRFVAGGQQGDEADLSGRGSMSNASAVLVLD
jgi:hypothetical protein